MYVRMYVYIYIYIYSDRYTHADQGGPEAREDEGELRGEAQLAVIEGLRIV